MGSAGDTPQVTVIMAVYNRAADIDGALDSIKDQDYPNLELVIFDGGSTDGTLERLHARQDEIDVLHSGPDDGIYDAWNQALTRASGSWILFLGSDDRYAHPKVVSELVAAARAAGDDTNLVVARGALMDANDGTVRQQFGMAWNARRMRCYNIAVHPACMTARSLIDRFGPFSLRVGIAADYDFYLRASAEVRAADLPRVVVHFATGGASSSDTLGLLRSVRSIQAAYPAIGPARAQLQYMILRGLVPLARRLRSFKPAHRVD